MENIHLKTFKGVIKRYFVHFYTRKPPPALFPPLCTGSLV
jgi:hypothetical protein